ncbi:hypothetical protein QWJ26_07355 [Streptomyces sp. CSDS2]|uniref:DUF3592 domain-containing protein n=1 Tax=Streptomyces sp. CSDS2 TaxID=3055051 RepID=UPI0025B14BF1|nr:DUF3592 domain-containing protein [Streptomyces sp. CSDS2]MDN3259635.1 hypothetical protein [Streptomyces sp. CSDS2]
MSIALWWLGIIFGALGVLDEVAHRRMRRVGRPAVGVVEDRIFRTGFSRPSAVMVRYVADSGLSFTSKLIPEGAEEMPQVGHDLSIYYNPHNANEVVLASSLDRPRRFFKDRGLLWVGTAALTGAIVLTVL